MSGFVSKLRALTLGTAHDLLDKAIDLNSPSIVRQYVRDLEDALDTLKTQLAVQNGQIRTTEREVGDLTSLIGTTEATISKLVAADHEDLARPKAAKLINLKNDLAAKQSSLTTQKSAVAKLEETVEKLSAKHEDMVNAVRNLENLDRDSKSREQAAKAIKQAGRLVTVGADAGIDDVTRKMQERNDVAGAKLDQAMNDIKVEEDPEHEAAIDDVLAGFKKEKAVAAN